MLFFIETICSLHLSFSSRTALTASCYWHNQQRDTRAICFVYVDRSDRSLLGVWHSAGAVVAGAFPDETGR